MYCFYEILRTFEGLILSIILEGIQSNINEIVRNNIWQISYLDIYDVVTVSRRDDGTIRVIFPFVSVDNMNFFTQYVLPEHVVK